MAIRSIDPSRLSAYVVILHRKGFCRLSRGIGKRYHEPAAFLSPPAVSRLARPGLEPMQQDTSASLLAAARSLLYDLSIFPAITALMALYGLISNRPMLKINSRLPAASCRRGLALLSDQVTNLLVKKNSTLGIGIATGAAVTSWSARSAALAVMAALNAIYEETEKRGLIPAAICRIGPHDGRKS